MSAKNQSNYQTPIAIEGTAVYTYEQLQYILGVKKTTLSKLIKEDNLKPIVLGKSYRFLGETILDFLRAQIK